MKLTCDQYAQSKETSCLGRWCLLSGPEEHLKREALARIKEEARERGGEEPSWEVLEGAEVKAADLLMRCQTGPLFPGPRLVVVHGAERIDAREQELLAKAVAELPPSVSVVLVTAESGARGQRRTVRPVLQRAIEGRGLSIEFASLNRQRAAAWAIRRAQGLGKRLEPSAAAKLAEQKVGTGLAALELEIEKLALFVGDRKTISSADVEEVTPRMIEEDVFRLIDAVANQQPGRAVPVLRALLHDRREEPLRILSMVAQAIREIWQCKLLIEHGWRQGDEPGEEVKALLLTEERRNVMRSFARRPWLIRHRVTQAGALSWSRLARAIYALHDCDLVAKGVAGKVTDEELALELLVVQLCTDLEMPVWERARPKKLYQNSERYR